MEALRENDDSLRGEAHQPFLFLLLAVGLGIAADRLLPLDARLWWSIAALTLCSWLLLWYCRWTRISTIALLTAIVAAAGCWHHAYWHLFPADHVGRSVDDRLRPICVRAEVVSEPRWVPAPPPDPMRTIPRGDSSRVEVFLLEARDGQTWRPMSGRVSVTIDGHLLGLNCGDRVMLFALADQPQAPSGPGEFDNRRHLRSERKLARMSSSFPDCVQLEQAAVPWRLDRLLANMRRSGAASLWRHVGPDQAPVAVAMTLGYREQLDRSVWDAFVETGSVHLLSISGLHVGILAFGLFAAARLLTLRRSYTLAMVIGVTVAYAFLVELEPPVVRSTAIIVIMCLAHWSGRTALSFNSLAASGVVVLALNPSDLYRIGPQFSFLAVAVLCATESWFTSKPPADPLARLIASSRPWYTRRAKRFVWGVYRLVGSSAAIWIIAVPLTMYHYHICAPIALLVYPLVVLPVSVAMLSGFGVLALSRLTPPLAQLCGTLCHHSLGCVEDIVEATHDLPGAYFWIPGPSWLLVGGFYLLMAGYAAWRQGRPAARWPLVIALAWIACLTFGSALAERRIEQQPRLACTFINVGHGTSALIELPSGKRLLYDAGSLGDPTSGERPIAAALWSRGITHLDAVVISHADADHYNALPVLLDKFSIGVVYVSPIMFEDAPPALRAFRESIERRGVEIREVYGGDRLGREEGVVIEVRHPPRRGVLGSDNANSIVLDISYAGRRILLPGDLESPGLEDCIAEESPGYDVVMAPHHGSAGSNPRGFAAWSRPQYVVISGGRSGDVSAVQAAYAEVGARSLHTADDGAIRVEIDRQGMRVRSWYAEPWK